MCLYSHNDTHALMHACMWVTAIVIVRRCDGSTDVTRGGVPHEPFGVWLKSQPVDNATIAKRYGVSDLFDLQAKRFAELGHARPGDEKGPFGSYAIPDPMPLVRSLGVPSPLVSCMCVAHGSAC